MFSGVLCQLYQNYTKSERNNANIHKSLKIHMYEKQSTYFIWIKIRKLHFYKLFIFAMEQEYNYLH